MATKIDDHVLANKPDDSAFKQQRLKAWQPILTPRWVIGTFILIGIVFVPIGISLKVGSDSLFEQTITYDGAPSQVTPGVSTNCSIMQDASLNASANNALHQNQGYNLLMAGTPAPCTLTFTLTQDLSSPLYMYYELTNFYQNHRRYVKSRNDAQCAGNAPGNASLATNCDPPTSFMTPRSTIYYPCGLIATSFFNDGFRVVAVNGVPNSAVSMDSTQIAWSTDFNSKFQNPTTQMNMWDLYQYVWQTYDQMSCRDNATFAVVPCLKWGDLVPGAYGRGCAQCPDNATAVSEGGVPPPGGWKNFNYSAGFVGTPNALYGLRDQHFLVWMRSAALPNFRKLYGEIVPAPGTTWKKGDTITINVTPNFEVQSYGGTKAIVISTATVMGGKSSVLGIAYLVVGSLCWALALAFGIKHTLAPRKLGDTKYIVWRRAGAAQ
jgi:hypothetical protein